MNLDILSSTAVGLVSMTGLLLLVSWDWRLSIAALAIQYIGAFILVLGSWPIELSVVKLVAGWMAGAVLGVAAMGMPQARSPEDRFHLSELLLRLLVGGMVGLVAISATPKMVTWVNEVSVQQASGGLVLIGLGLLQLGLGVQPLRIFLGLLTVLAGFEIIYAALETSTLVAGLLAVTNLGLALVGAFLLPSTGEPEAE